MSDRISMIFSLLISYRGWHNKRVVKTLNSALTLKDIEQHFIQCGYSDECITTSMDMVEKLDEHCAVTFNGTAGKSNTVYTFIIIREKSIQF